VREPDGEDRLKHVPLKATHELLACGHPDRVALVPQPSETWVPVVQSTRRRIPEGELQDRDSLMKEGAEETHPLSGSTFSVRNASRSPHPL
jgi:hypothetical protein